MNTARDLWYLAVEAVSPGRGRFTIDGAIEHGRTVVHVVREREPRLEWSGPALVWSQAVEEAAESLFSPPGTRVPGPFWRAVKAAEEGKGGTG